MGCMECMRGDPLWRSLGCSACNDRVQGHVPSTLGAGHDVYSCGEDAYKRCSDVLLLEGFSEAEGGRAALLGIETGAEGNDYHVMFVSAWFKALLEISGLCSLQGFVMPGGSAYEAARLLARSARFVSAASLARFGEVYALSGEAPARAALGAATRV